MDLDDLSKSNIKDHNMDKHNTKKSISTFFSQINFDSLSAQAKQAINEFNRYVKKCDFVSFLKLLLFAINDETESLRHLENMMLVPDLQKEIGFNSISYSQLSRNLRKVPTAALMEIFLQLVKKLDYSFPSSNHKKWFLIDSTTFTFSQASHPWARYRTTKAGIKVHLKVRFMEKGELYPVAFEQSVASEHDKNYLLEFLTDSNATYIFDRAYLDYGLLDQMDDQGFFFVTRLKSDSLVCDMQESSEIANENTSIVSDCMARLGGKTDITNRFRVITIRRKNKSDLRLVTNRHDLSAEEISHIYQSRWQIELFFKHIKQHLTIKNFFSKTEEGVTNHVILAMIAYLLTALLRQKYKFKQSHFQVLRTIRTLWFEPLSYLLECLHPTWLATNNVCQFR